MDKDQFREWFKESFLTDNVGGGPLQTAPEDALKIMCTTWNVSSFFSEPMAPQSDHEICLLSSDRKRDARTRPQPVRGAGMDMHIIISFLF